jgi:hypothetical protein
MEHLKKTDYQKEKNNELVYSYQTLRNLIGFSGMSLPLLLILFTLRDGTDNLIEPSISDYYYTSTGDVLVVILCILGAFLFTYKGYNWKEKCWSVAASIGAFGIAFSPTVTKYTRQSASVHTENGEVAQLFGFEWHLVFALLSFFRWPLYHLSFLQKREKVSRMINLKTKRIIGISFTVFVAGQ